jgi:hypothetical protein
MSLGYRDWNAAGNLIVDTNNRLSRVLGTVDITGGVSGSVTNADFAQGTPFWICTAKEASYSLYSGGGPNISVSGSTLSWDFTGRAPRNARLVYGVY